MNLTGNLERCTCARSQCHDLRIQISVLYPVLYSKHEAPESKNGISCTQKAYLPTPTKTVSTPALKTSPLFLPLSDNSQQRCHAARGGSRQLLHKLILLLVVLLAACKPRALRRLAIEEVRDQDERVERGGEEVGALQGLRRHAEDVYYVYDGLLRGLGTGYVWRDVSEAFILFYYFLG